jgi:hypothetical protein
MRTTLPPAVVALAIVAVTAAPALAADNTITALGTGQAKVKPAHPKRNASIVKAVDRAYARAVPKAITDAREDAERIARSSGLSLGAIQSVDENVNTGGGYFAGGPNLSPFGQDQYCGKIRRRVHRRDNAGNLHTVVRSQRRCFVPEFAYSTLAVTFAATPR